MFQETLPRIRRLAEIEEGIHGHGILGGPDNILQGWASEARRNRLDPDVIVQLSQWGRLTITSEKCFTLELGRERFDPLVQVGDRKAGFIFNGNKNEAAIVIKEYLGGERWAHVVELPSIPASNVGINTGFGSEALFAICDFGILGKMKFGITRECEFVFESSINFDKPIR